tara:strand:- start:243 stop:1361 length:1119 start_codon:yes stop_codon:yes gene_type:complete
MPLTKVQSRGTENVGQGSSNVIINGAMNVAQRGTSAVTINSGSSTYLLDRFYASGASSAGVFTVEQSTDAPTDFKNSLKVTVTTADSSIGSTTNYRVNQNIEGQNISSLNYGASTAKTVTLSFYVKSSLTGTFGGKLGNSARDRSHPFTYTISSANTWEQKTVTITGDTSGTWLDTNGIGFELVWSIGAGSGRLGTAGTWAGVRYDGATGQTNIIATNSSTWLITGVQLEVGSQASDFQHEDYGTTLLKCQRYFEHCFDHGTFPVEGNNYGLGMTLYNGVTWINDNMRAQIHFLVRKRSDPTMTAFNVTGLGSGTTANRWRWWSGSAWQETDQATDLGELNHTGCMVNVTESDASATNAYMVGGGWSADAEL